jgi:hypothetical protein
VLFAGVATSFPTAKSTAAVGPDGRRGDLQQIIALRANTLTPRHNSFDAGLTRD